MRLTKEQFEESYRKAKYQLELEGFEMTEDDKESVRKVAMGEMTREELIEKLKFNERAK